MNFWKAKGTYTPLETVNYITCQKETNVVDKIKAATRLTLR